MDTLDKIDMVLEVITPDNLKLSDKILKMRVRKKGVSGAIKTEIPGIKRYTDKLSLAVKMDNTLAIKKILREMISDLNRISKLVK
jgi:predicted DNA-binding protein YlxM (UPF0122 family)